MDDVQDVIWCGCGSGRFERQIHEKRRTSAITSISNSTTTSIITTHAKRHVPRAMLNDTYKLPSPIEPRSSIHAQRRRRRRIRRRRRRRHVVWS